MPSVITGPIPWFCLAEGTFGLAPIVAGLKRQQTRSIYAGTTIHKSLEELDLLLPITTPCAAQNDHMSDV